MTLLRQSTTVPKTSKVRARTPWGWKLMPRMMPQLALVLIWRKPGLRRAGCTSRQRQDGCQARRRIRRMDFADSPRSQALQACSAWERGESAKSMRRILRRAWHPSCRWRDVQPARRSPGLRQINTSASCGIMRGMSFQPHGVRALTFDVFGTVVDWRSSVIAEGLRR